MISLLVCHSTLLLTDETRIWDSNSFPGMIRLQRGKYVNQGRVEIYCNGQWGTICDDGFSSYDARTVCKQLGYTSYSNYDHLSKLILKITIFNSIIYVMFRPAISSTPIWLTHVSSYSNDVCIGRSNSCPATPVSSCFHYEDVTIECSKYDS